MKQKSVKIYSSPTCPHCREAKKFLENHKIEFEDYNVASDKAAREEMVRKSGEMRIPVIDIGGNLIIGFDEAQLKEKLGL